MALVTFCAAFALGAWTTGQLGLDDDTACGQIGLATRHPGLQFESVKVAPPTAHCPYCHWQRVLRGAAFLDLAGQRQALEALDRILPPSANALSQVGTDNDPSRGPPVRL